MYFNVLFIYAATHDGHQVLESKILDSSSVHANQSPLFSLFSVNEEFKKT